MMDYKSILLVCLLSVCLGSAQQTGQQQNDVTATDTCNATSTKPAAKTGTYIFEKCIVAKFASHISIGQGKYIELSNGVVDTNKSHCETVGNQTVDPMLVVNFTCGQIAFEISHSNDSKIFVKAINGYYKILAESYVFSNSTPSFITDKSGTYYKCNAEQAIPISVPAKSPNSEHLVISNFAYEAYRTATSTDFYKIAEECALDAGQVSDLVRIGVGICLVALVVIVLIAYFVGRRRWSERSSYESV